MSFDPFFVSTTNKKRKTSKNNKTNNIKFNKKNKGKGNIVSNDGSSNDDDDEIGTAEEDKIRDIAEKRRQIDRDLIAARLRDDALDRAGRLHHLVADKFDFSSVALHSTAKIKSGRHDLSVTCLAVPESGQYFYTASKDHSIIKWDLATGKKLHVFPGGRKEIKNFDGHTKHILSLAISSDENYLASGGADKKINIWSVKENKFIKCLLQHKDSVSGLVFRKGHNQLYSASFDRTIKLWDIDQLGFIETLFGHQDQIMSIDTISKERCITAGARDRTCRLWKIVEQTQLVFRGDTKGANFTPTTPTSITQNQKEDGGGGIDVVAMIDEDNFLSGGDSGDVYWITALTTIRHSDLFASGSWDGYIRFWKLVNNIRSFVPLAKIPILGFINCLHFITPTIKKSKNLLLANKIDGDDKNGVDGEDVMDIEDINDNNDVKEKNGEYEDEMTKMITTTKGKTYILAGVGQEHKLGRWLRLKKARNGWKLVELDVKK
ncbi:246_t:CDS:2 [Entrophospora sp. SA101]|nr:9842_t:CDS:2 [Entrophospora sp. SA101]CAJ0636582.1 246_t:CDS:2 [Entrophospora sp. SA101]CAJ0844111.1 7362_t:CDS:2 [Entrophospora sp. SA101]